MPGGTLAMNAYTGLWRDTKDLDVFVPAEAVPRVLEVLEGRASRRRSRSPTG
jgi:hypothetical protein